MSLSPETAERHARDLARFQAIAMHAAEKAHAALEATQDSAELCALVSAIGKAGRVLRMSMALEARLAREQARDAREAEGRDEARAQRAVLDRKARVTHALDRMIWTECEREDAQVATAELYERLDAEALSDGFTDEPVEVQVQRLAEVLGLTGEPRRPYVPRDLRHQPHRFYRPEAIASAHDFLRDDDDEDDEYDDEDAPEDEDGAPEEPLGETPASEPGAERLAPPVDLPSWDTG